MLLINMNRTCYLLLLILLIQFLSVMNQNEDRILSGTMISSDENSNLIKYAFDGDVSTQFKTSIASNGWVGLNFHNEFIIGRIDWAQKEDDHDNYLLGIFEGANTKTFEDAIPLYVIKEKGKIRENNVININFKKKFQYIRYIGPHGKYCKISNFKVYGNYDSEMSSNYYQLTNLPLIAIHSKSGKEPQTKNDKIQCNFLIIDDKKLNIDTSGELSLKGIESLNLEKKTYDIVLEDSKQPLDFKSKSKKWALIGNYGDKTLIRNLITFEISRIFNMTFTSNCKSVDLMINGEYKGNYNLCEKIEVLETRLNLKHLTENDNSISKISGGYIIETDGFAYLGNLYFNSRKGVPVSIRYPELDSISSQQKAYIKEKFDELELEIYNNNITNIDLTSFAKFFLIEELIGNAEAYWSTFLYKDRNDNKFYFGPIWDNDMTFDNDNRVYPINCKTEFIFNNGIAAGTMDKLIIQILKNETVFNLMKQIWKEITETKLNEANLNTFIDEQVELIKESKNLNFIRWDILNKQVSFNPKIYGSYKEEVLYLKSFIKNRINWLSNYFLKTKKELNIVCEYTEKNVTKSELIYEIDNAVEDEVDYKLLPYSNSELQLKDSFFHKLNILFLILILI